jgi:L-2-hydroxyglutarate oxidase LhgO
MLEQAASVGAPGLELLGPDGIRDREPHVIGRAALWSPTTAIVDYGAIARALADDVTTRGGVVRTGALVTSIADIDADEIVVCAGLQTDRVSRLAGGPDDPRIVPFRGEYLRLRPERAGLVQGLVYPLPDPQYPFLGVHFTPRTSGVVDVGPNAVLALAREGYRWRDISPGDLADALGFPGLWRFLRRHSRLCAEEVLRSASLRLACRSLQKMIPELSPRDLQPGGAGVRAQAMHLDGTLLQDFWLEQRPGALHLLNAPSPAATASLAIAREIVGRLPFAPARDPSAP